MADSLHRVVVVGLGNVSTMWLPTLVGREDVEIVGVADIDELRAHAVTKSYGLSCGIYPDVKTAVTMSEPSLVVDLTPPDQRRAVVGKALELGCNVFGEKPMAASLEEAIELVALATVTGKTYSVMQQRRYVIGSRTLRDGVHAGRIGLPEFICVDYFMAPHFRGFRGVMKSPLLLDMAIHTFDQARFIAGVEPCAVYCHEFNPPSSRYEGAAAAVCTFECVDGSVISYRGSWAAEGCATTWESDWRVVGSDGTAIWDGSGLPYSEAPVHIADEGALFSPVQRSDWSATYAGPEGHAGCIDALLSAAARGVRAETDCADNLASLAMVFGALESARRGQRVLISDVVRAASRQ